MSERWRFPLSDEPISLALLPDFPFVFPGRSSGMGLPFHFGGYFLRLGLFGFYFMVVAVA
jgi:hypothetical protein